MDQIKIAKQIVNFQKTGFDTAYNAMKIMQDCADSTTSRFLSQNENMVKDGLAFVTEWMSSVKKGQDELRQSVSEKMDTKVFETNREMVDQIQSQTEAVTKAMFNQSARLCQRGAQLYNDGVESRNAILSSYKQGVDAAFKSAEDMFEK